jgi:putative oxidoreductase
MQNIISVLKDPNNAKLAIDIVRIITGLFMVYHGYEVFDSEKMKAYYDWEMFKSESSKFLPYLGKGAEFIGGILLALGIYTRLGAIIIFGTMAYIAFFVGKGKIWYEDQHPFMFCLLAIIFLFTGAYKIKIKKS